LGFADFGGNQQYISAGDLWENPVGTPVSDRTLMVSLSIGDIDSEYDRVFEQAITLLQVVGH